jgi:two-component system, chemotaxis family, chemotaxis protein CheY
MAIKVMIVDDVVLARKMLREMFSGDRFEVVAEATNGQEAVDQYRATKPDLVAMDIVMPMMSGVVAIREILKIDPQAKIIVCTAVGEERLVREALDAGAKSFLVKPFQAEDVHKVVETVLKE